MPPWMRGRARSAVGGLHENLILRVLRPGGVTVEEMERVLAGHDEPALVHRDFKDEAIEQPPTTPGMKHQHYSPSSSRRLEV